MQMPVDTSNKRTKAIRKAHLSSPSTHQSLLKITTFGNVEQAQATTRAMRAQDDTLDT
jgi:hypothetical protein